MLSDFRVLDLSDERGMLAGLILADLGADVIAVEPPGGSSARRLGPFFQDSGDGEDSLFWWSYGRNKRGIVLDLDDPSGPDELLALAASADVVFESFEPGFLDARGIGYAGLSAINPGISLVSITPFGQSGPKALWASNALTGLAASCVLDLTGDEDRAPLQVPGAQAYLHAGAEAAVGALIALRARERDGHGQHVDVSTQVATAMATQSFILTHGWDPSEPMGRLSGGARWGEIRGRFIYPASDGHVSVTFLFGEMIGPYTARLFEWMYEEGVADERARNQDWVEFGVALRESDAAIAEMERCQGLIAEFTSGYPKQFLFEEALRRRLLIVPVSSTGDVVESEQLAARDFWTPIEHPRQQTTVSYPGPFAKFSATPLQYRRPAPALGEHTEEVRAERRASKATVGEPAVGRPAVRAPIGAPPLEGLKVLDLSWVFATPVGVRYLADYGATVVHVETTTRVDAMRNGPPWWQGEVGADRAGQFANVQTNKLALTANLATPEGRDLVRRLVAWADVVAEAFSPKAMRAWGLDYGELRRINPAVIMLSCCLNGQTGPQAMLQGFGTMGAQMAGFGNLVGWPDRAPAAPFAAYTDYTTPKFVASALLAALHHRDRTGEGQYIDLSQAEAATQFLAPYLLDYSLHGRVTERAGNRSPHAAPHGVYPCRGEDRWVALASESDEQWQALCAVLGRGDWADDAELAGLAGRWARADELDAGVAAWTATLEVDEVELALQAVGVPVHRVARSEDAWNDPQLAHRGHFAPARHPTLGEIPLEAPRIGFSRTKPGRMEAAHPFGFDNEYVLRELLGLSEGEIEAITIAGGLD